MRKMLLRLILPLTICLLIVAPLTGAEKEKKKEVSPPKIKIGDTAPDFTLKYWDGTAVKEVSLHDFRGKKNVALAFFVFAFTPG